MTCVYKKYEGSIKMVQEHKLQLKKMKFLLSYNMKILTKLGGREMTFGGEMGKFLASGVGTPAPPASRENPVVFPPKKTA